MIFKILLSRSVQTPNSDKNRQTSCPLQTFVCNRSRHLEFIIEHGHRVNWVSGSLDSRVTGSLGHKMWPSSMSVVLRHSGKALLPPNQLHLKPRSHTAHELNWTGIVILNPSIPPMALMFIMHTTTLKWTETGSSPCEGCGGNCGPGGK